MITPKVIGEIIDGFDDLKKVIEIMKLILDSEFYQSDQNFQNFLISYL